VRDGRNVESGGKEELKVGWAKRGNDHGIKERSFHYPETKHPRIGGACLWK